MGRGTLWAATSGPEVSAEALSSITASLNITSLPTPLVSSAVFRHLRTLLNLTQREYGILISPEGTTPISASVICQLETGTQAIPASLIGRAAAGATAVQTFADWRREAQAGCYDSQLSALRALGPGCESELQPYLDRKGELPPLDRTLVTEYLDIVSKRKQTGSGDRPATRGPYKKNKKEGAEKESASSSEGSVVGDDSAKPSVARGPRGPYKVKRKQRPMAVGLATGEVSPSDSSSTAPTTPSTARSDSSTSTLSVSSPHSDASFEPACFDTMSSPTSAALNFCLGDGQTARDELKLFKDSLDGAQVTPRTHAATLDFLERLEEAEARDAEVLNSARESEATAAQRRLAMEASSLPGRSPRGDTPRGDSKRRATKARPKAQPLSKELEVVDLDRLNLDDFTLDELMAEPPEQDTPPLQSVDEIMELVCKEMESPRWSDFDYDGSVLADCHC